MRGSYNTFSQRLNGYNFSLEDGSEAIKVNRFTSGFPVFTNSNACHLSFWRHLLTIYVHGTDIVTATNTFFNLQKKSCSHSTTIKVLFLDRSMLVELYLLFMRYSGRTVSFSRHTTEIYCLFINHSHIHISYYI